MSKAVRISGWILWFLIATQDAFSQFRSNKGKEFWLGYAHNFYFQDPEGNFPNGQTMVLYLTAERTTQATVTVNGTAWSQTVTIPGGGVNATIEIPKTGAADARLMTEGKSVRGIHIVAEDSIVAYAHQYGVQSSAAMLLFPVDTYGYSYTSMNYTQGYIQGNERYVWTVIVASEDNTRVEITSSENTVGGRQAGVPFTVDLNKGEVYQLFGELDANRQSKDLTGTRVKSVAGGDGKCHPIAMYAGSSILRLCNGDGGEFMWQQMFPRSAWGTSYLTYKTVHPKGTLFQPYLNIYRIMVSDPATVVKVNGNTLTGLIKNTYYEVNTTTGDFIEANQPIMVTQYAPGSNQCQGPVDRNAGGDPEMFILTPMQQGIKSAVFYNTRRQNIDLNYFDLIIHKNGLSSLRVNGNAVPAASITPHPANGDYSVVVFRLLGAGRHNTVTSDSVFYAKVYGYGAFESYGYNLGTMINNLNGIFAVNNIYNNTGAPNPFTCAQTPFNLSVKLAYRATAILWEFSKTKGLSRTTDTLMTNPQPVETVVIAGRTYYTYALPTPLVANQTGIIEIPVWATAPEVDYCDKTEPFIYQLDVRQGPLSDFTINFSGCLSDTARFTGTPNPRGNTLDRYVWTHFDGQVDSALNSKKKFPAGTHPVHFRVITDNGCVHDTVKTVTPTQVPLAQFSVNKDRVCLGEPIRFTDASGYADGAITEWHWSFDNVKDSVLTNGNPFDYTYPASGTYRVSLWVNTDNNCKSDSAFATVTVQNRPTASFTNAGRPCVDSAMVYTSTANAQGNTLVQWGWRFDNNPPILAANGNPQSVTYTTPGGGRQVLHWVVTDAGCSSDTASALAFTIFPNPVASFTVQADSLCTGTPVTFINNGSSSDVTAWRWNLGNGTSTQAPPITTTYNTAGNYNVTLQVLNAQGCSSVPVSQPVTMLAQAAVDAGPDLMVPRGESITLQASSSGSGTFTYQWTPATWLSNATVLRPESTPQEDITYVLLATNNGTCAAIDSMKLQVLQDIYVPTGFSPNGDRLNDTWNIPGLQAYPEAVIRLFDRYGQVIYQDKGGLRPWDGTINGKPMPVGVYPWILDLGDGSPRRTGTVTLLR